MLKFRSQFAFPVVIAVLTLVWRGNALRQKLQRDALCVQEYEAPPAGMVLVPAGEFWMGSDEVDAEPDERPLRKVFVPAFYIDRFEVTNRRFRELMPEHRFANGEDDLPVTHVLKRDAEEYCRRANRRLPAAAEWEKAARGTDGRLYPWGNEFSAAHANISRRPTVTGTNAESCRSPLSPSRGKRPGGAFPSGASPYGCEDMAGNVWEWVSDVWVDRNELGMRRGPEARGIIRGGAYSYSARQARASYQGFEALASTCHDVGFRCAMDASPRRER